MVDTPYRRFVMLIVVSTIPTGIMGVLGQNLIEAASATVLVPGICPIITSILLFISDRVKTGKKTEENASYGNAVVIGVCQGFATLPGLSRSGTTITACLLSGFDRFRSKILLYHVHSGSAWGSRFGTEGFESCNNSIF